MSSNRTDTPHVDPPASEGEPLLVLDEVNAAVEDIPVLQGISLTVGRGEAVALVGRNGAGKTTTFRAIMGLGDITSGAIRFRGEDLTTVHPERIPRLGISYQPEGRELFTGMNIDENLRLPIWVAGHDRGIENEDEVVEDIYSLFDEIADQRDTKVQNLSGGQGKMVAIGRALALQPDLLLLDEPLEGLAPVVVQNLKQHIHEIMDRGISVLIAESNASHVPDIVDRMYVIERGEIVAEGDPEHIAADQQIQQYFQG